MITEDEDDDLDGKVVVDTRICSQPGCGGPASGICINNLPFDDCPDVIDAEPDPIDGEGPEATRSSAGYVQMPGGHAFDARACDALLRQRSGVVVGLVAGPDVGKTTLIGLMYELLIRRRMRHFQFAGSETLRGYEERCHLARTTSNGSKPDTQRTATKAKLSFTHLQVAKEGRKSDVVFSDRSGEHFQRALDRPNEIGGFEELQRSDVILLLVDLPELLKNTHAETSQMRKWFMAMKQNGILDGKPTFLVGTKADVAVKTPRSKAAAIALETLALDLSRRIDGPPVAARLVACRPRMGSTVIGEGVEELLTEILAPKPSTAYIPTKTWPRTETELDLLMRGYRAKSS